MNRLTVYTQPGCASCGASIRRLKSLGIEHTTIDVTEDAEAARRLKAAGFQTAPVFGFGGSLHTIVDLSDIINQIQEATA
ncbi:glutaredoxin family protein [Microbacterium sp. zg-YB36]|uniref:glutaredoxin family protein n=1 Tax=Microbacterium sp. zg-YB36 TaxID=2969407 RepID=UPI00214B1434|nr:glutaredoxin family protein [Microbacterium sp. zg-YB36]MDL5351196.1 glutaredoxin family protein [Microbacterium sp. zg-YB36]